MTIGVMLSINGFGEEETGHSPRLSPPSPEINQTVNAVIGKWAGQMTATVPGQEVERFNWTIDCEAVALGAGASCSQRGNPSIGSLAESCLVAYDPEGKAVHKMCVSSTGEVHDHKGRWKDRKTIEFEPLHGTMGGKPIIETVTMTFPDARTITNKSVFDLPDGSHMSFDFVGKRK